MEPYIGELRIFPFNFVPKGWLACNGQILSVGVQENKALFGLIGNIYGGDGVSNFALPDLQGRMLMSATDGFTMGQKGGSNSSIMNMGNLPVHSHQLMAAGTLANKPACLDNAITLNADLAFAPNKGNKVLMNGKAVATTGASTPISNMQPYLGLNICIAKVGIHPRPGSNHK